ncbi:ArfGap-domain-containing protein [Gonapodya prolifera JEL478]|uniref:ArfGap-domain-containing protein n=1 Tax=Gonapodya prolifera (strain JEL478) TaxID=1344416 RepID=A0A139A069_GONPJ|nr:ArfGap-domain-containing protein [Gonapodya prolifera JEL478]|eukprot:KXS10177.1 ArfGap-domain-containing protein [Gonapodya prolifera JEL478]
MASSTRPPPRAPPSPGPAPFFDTNALVDEIPLVECFDDDPKFRRKLAQYDANVAVLESALKGISRTALLTTDANRELAETQAQLANDLGKLADIESSDPIIAKSLNRFRSAFQELDAARTSLAEQVEALFVEPVAEFVENRVGEVKKSSSDHRNASTSYESALLRYLGRNPRDPSLQSAQGSMEVTDARKSQHRASLEHVSKLNELQAKRRFEVAESIISLVYSQYSFHHQAYELLRDVEPALRDLAAHATELREVWTHRKTPSVSDVVAMTKHLYDPANPRPPLKDLDPLSPKKSGYLFKRKYSRLRGATWQRRWWEVDGARVGYVAGVGKGWFGAEGEVEETKAKDFKFVPVDMRLCMVRDMPDADRRFCFELVSPLRGYILQAENESDFFEWMNAMQQAIGRALHVERPEEIMGQAAVNAMAQQPLMDEAVVKKIVQEVSGNEYCVDCGDPSPTWASINLGVTLCITCSGIHRGLGRHVSKVRSLGLDRWEAEMVEMMQRLGNNQVNEIYEATLRTGTPVPLPSKLEIPSSNSDRATKELFIREKYLNRSFVWTNSMNNMFIAKPVHEFFWDAVSAGDLISALKFLTLQADVNWQNPGARHASALHRSAAVGDAPASEFLLQWGAKVDMVDRDGRTPLHEAVLSDDPRLVVMLLRRNAVVDATDSDNKTPLDLALNNPNPNSTIITTLQMVHFHKTETGSNLSLEDILSLASSSSTPSLSRKGTRKKHQGDARKQRPIGGEGSSQHSSVPARAAAAVVGGGAANPLPSPPEPPKHRWSDDPGPSSPISPMDDVMGNVWAKSSPAIDFSDVGKRGLKGFPPPPAMAPSPSPPPHLSTELRLPSTAMDMSNIKIPSFDPASVDESVRREFGAGKAVVRSGSRGAQVVASESESEGTEGTSQTEESEEYTATEDEDDEEDDDEEESDDDDTETRKTTPKGPSRKNEKVLPVDPDAAPFPKLRIPEIPSI